MNFTGNLVSDQEKTEMNLRQLKEQVKQLSETAIVRKVRYFDKSTCFVDYELHNKVREKLKNISENIIMLELVTLEDFKQKIIDQRKENKFIQQQINKN